MKLKDLIKELQRLPEEMEVRKAWPIKTNQDNTIPFARQDFKIDKEGNLVFL